MSRPNIVFLFSNSLTIQEVRAVWTEVFPWSTIVENVCRQAGDWKLIVISSLLD